MTPMTFYLIIVAILSLLSLAIAFNFLRYRFTGDKTFIFLTLFAILFIANVIFTLSLFDYSAPTQPFL